MATVTADRPARERLLDAAGELFYESGIAATGVDAVLARARVSPATLYAHFSGKGGLVAAYLERRFRRWQQTWDEVLDERTDPVDRLLSVFDAVVRYREAEGNRRGCAFLAAATELPLGHPGQQWLAADSHLLAERLRQLAEAADATTPPRSPTACWPSTTGHWPASRGRRPPPDWTPGTRCSAPGGWQRTGWRPGCAGPAPPDELSGAPGRPSGDRPGRHGPRDAPLARLGADADRRPPAQVGGDPSGDRGHRHPGEPVSIRAVPQTVRRRLLPTGGRRRLAATVAPTRSQFGEIGAVTVPPGTRGGPGTRPLAPGGWRAKVSGR
jgi:AcrR family transcriptional regulator